MKKLMLCSAAVIGIAAAAPAPAMAQLDVTVGGHSKNYIGWLDQDTTTAADERSFDMIRESEIHFNAEGVADNGLTYGVHFEVEADEGDSSDMEESYAYFSGDFGRVNLGSEDGANYLLQVAAPSADANIDGLRQYINPINYDLNGAGGTAAGATGEGDGFDYDNDFSGQEEKVTYLSPVWNGFQLGLSYTPEVENDDGSLNGLEGFNADDESDDHGEAYDVAGRYEGTYNNVGFAVGAGYTHAELEEDSGAGEDDFQEWNVGADLDVGPFGVGAIYTENNNGSDDVDEDDTIVVGVDYTTGPFVLGASYYTRDDEIAAGDVETDRMTGGVVYTAAPGLTFRGSILFSETEVPAATGDDTEGTAVLGGVQVNF